MANFLVQCVAYGYTTIVADSREDAEKKLEGMSVNEFELSRDLDTSVLDEVDDNNCQIEKPDTGTIGG